MNFFFFMFSVFLLLSIIGTTLYLWGVSIQPFLYALAIFQLFFIVYRFRLRTEIDDFYVLFPLLSLILLIYFFKWIFFSSISTEVSKKGNILRFFMTFIKIAFEESFLILHYYFKQNRFYEKFMIGFFCKFVIGNIEKYPFIFLVIFLFFPSLILNCTLFLEVVLYNTLFFSLYIFVLNFVFNTFLRLVFFFSRYYFEEHLQNIVNFFKTLSDTGEIFLKTAPLTTTDFSLFGLHADKAKSTFFNYHRVNLYFNSSLGYYNILLKIKPFLFAIFTFNLFICCCCILFSWSVVFFSYMIFFLLGVPLFFYLFVLLLSILFEEVIEMFSFLYSLGKVKKINIFAFICLFLFLLFFGIILLNGISVYVLFFLLLFFIVVFHKKGKILVDYLLYFYSLIYRKSCEYAWFRKFTYFLGFNFVDKLLTHDIRFNKIISFYYYIFFFFMMLFVFTELYFYSFFRYGIVVIFFFLINFSFFFIIRAYNFEQVKAKIEILMKNCNFEENILKYALLKPEDFIGHVTVIEDVWYQYLLLRDYNKNFIFASNVLYSVLCAYFIYFFRWLTLLVFLFIFVKLCFYYNVVFLLSALVLLFFAYLPEINAKMYFSSFSVDYLLQIVQFSDFFSKEYLWFAEQCPRAELIFAPFIKARQKKVNEDWYNLQKKP
jgi:hypothetical protein